MKNSKGDVLAIIPARANSKGIPGKNLKILSGKPLIAYSIEHAKRSKRISRFIVSTDSRKISDIASACGAEVPFVRPADLASDDAGTIPVLHHAIDWLAENEGYTPDIIVLLQPTSPIRKASDIDQAIDLVSTGKADSVISVNSATKNPYFNMLERVEGKLRLSKFSNAKTRQSAPEVWDINGSIYVCRTEALRKADSFITERTELLVLPKERSVDIDDQIDLQLAELLLTQ